MGKIICRKMYKSTCQLQMDRLASKAIEFANLTLTIQYTYSKTQPLLSTSYSVISSITLADRTVFSYNYDSNVNITKVYENSILKQSYVYDALDQLVRENNAYANRTYVWVYGNGGNILSKTEYQYTTGALGAVQNRECKIFSVNGLFT